MPIHRRCFDNTTAFFSHIHTAEDVRESVFSEAHRVLKPGGEFWIWDVNMPSESKVFAIRLQVEIPENRSVKTVYAVKAKNQSAEVICGSLQDVGFETDVIANHKFWFFFKARNMA